MSDRVVVHLPPMPQPKDFGLDAKVPDDTPAAARYAKALKVADPHDPDNAEALLLEGLRRFKFSPDPTYRPHPATWLNQRRWQDDAPEAEFDSTLAAAGLKPEDFR